MNKVLGVVLATVFSASATGLAADPDFRISVSSLRAGMAKKTEKQDGSAEVKTDTNTLTTFPAGSLELAAFPSGYAIYIYPLQEGGAIWLGKALSESMEAGLTIGMKGVKVKDAGDASATSIGLYYWGSAPVGAFTFETNLNPYLTISSTKTENTPTGATTATKTESKYTKIGFAADAGIVVPLAKNFEYVGGFDLSYSGGDVKTKVNAGPEGTVKESELNLGIVLAKFRAKF